MGDSCDLMLGFDIGGTKCAVVLGTIAGDVIGRVEVQTCDPGSTIDRLIEGGQALVGDQTVVACGVSCGSPLSRAEGLILSPPNMKQWVRVPIVSRIREQFHVPVNIENDADAGALAEWRWGLNREVDDVVYLTCGTGQGSGLVLGGRLHRGVNNLAGEIGHVRLAAIGPVGCNKAGSVEGFTSGRALGEIAKLRLGEPHPTSLLDSIPIDSVTGKDVGEAALAGDTFAQSVVCEVGGYLGQACAIIVDLLNPGRISLGSLAVRLGDLIVEPVRAVVDREAMGPSAASCVIDAAALGDRVQDLAALAVAGLVHPEAGE